MSSKQDTQENEVFYLRAILKAQTTARRFNAGSAAVIAIAGSVGFVMALAFNDAMQKSFGKIQIGQGLLGAWIYALIMLFIGIFLLFLMYVYLEPFAASKF